MIKSNMHYQVTSSINSLSLFGYKDLFNSFVKMYENNVLPNTIFLSGQQGIGKSTFAFHFINFLLSRDELAKYSLENLTINPDNRSYKLLCEKLHSNFFLLENHLSDEIIKIEQIRNLLNFLNKSTYSKDLKIVLINNAEFLNKSSSNALLKVLEEPPDQTIIILVSSQENTIIDTIKSRCQNIYFPPISNTIIQEKLENMGQDPYKASVIARISSGDIGLSRKLIDDYSDIIKKLYIFLNSCFSQDPTIWEKSIDITARLKNKDFQNLEQLFRFLMLFFRDMLYYKNTGSDNDIAYKNHIEKKPNHINFI